MLALNHSTGLNIKSLHAKRYITLATGFEHKTPETGLKSIDLILIMVSNKKISTDFTI